jgi:tetratricopeptide (TPR) repeat protein
MVVAGRRDEVATIGSINWLRHAMDLAGANSNVVRNIIYRDKGRLHDKRALYLILVDLRAQLGLSPIEDPALTLLASPFAAAELEVSQVLGREQRRVYRAFVGGVRAGAFPKTLVTGKPGAGKTLLLDYLQQGLEIEPRAADMVARADFTDADLTAGLVRLATQLGVAPDLIESRLVRIGSGSSFAVQADSQAEVARVILDSQRHRHGSLAVLVHMSRALSAEGTLGAVPLRLNTPEVPRVSAADWLWFTLLRPLALAAGISVFVSTSSLPAKAVESFLPFDGPVALAQPTAAEARRYVRSLATQLDVGTCDDIVRRAGRSYEELRTLTLLALAKRHSSDEGAHADDGGERALGERALEELTALVETTAEPTLRAYLAALAVVSSREAPGFTIAQLVALRGGRRKTLNDLESSFIDQLPGSDERYRCFSRRFARALHERLSATQTAHAMALHRTAAQQLEIEAIADPVGEAAGAHLYHLLAGRDWPSLLAWMSSRVVPFPLLTRLWATARTELGAGNDPLDNGLLEHVALELARHLLRLGADQHVELVRAFELLAASASSDTRAWAAVLRAQLEVAAGRFERATVLLDVSPPADDPLLDAEQRLARASVLRWRGELDAASAIVAQVRDDHTVPQAAPSTHSARAVLARTAVWSGLIEKDRGDLGAAMAALSVDVDSDDLLRGRLAFQRGDVLLRLGLFDGASVEFDRAIRAAGRSGALAQERARYLARRGTLRRLTGDVARSRHDFAAAREVLHGSELTDLDLDFALAKLADESSYTLLADGDFEEAIVANTTALATFRTYQDKRDVEAGFRIARSSLRLAVAYAFRGFALPFRRPLPAFRPHAAGPDLDHALHAMDTLITDLERPGSRVVASTSAVDGLLGEARVLASLVSPDAHHALRHADAALEGAHYHYHRARAQSARAGALLALTRPADALAAIADGEAELCSSLRPDWLPRGSQRPEPDNGDLSLVAQFGVYRAGAHLIAGDQNEAAESVWRTLDDARLVPFHEAALRAFGEAAESLARDGAWKRHRHLRTLLGVNGTGPSTPARLPDALVAAWRSRTPTV